MILLKTYCASERKHPEKILDVENYEDSVALIKTPQMLLALAKLQLHKYLLQVHMLYYLDLIFLKICLKLLQTAVLNSDLCLLQTQLLFCEDE